MNIVSFSGGKDSTAMLILMEREGIPIDKIVFYDTMWEFPAMYSHIEKVQERFGHIDIITPGRPPMFLMSDKTVNNKSLGKQRAGYGFPTALRRWCTQEKKSALGKYSKKMNGTYFIGIAADEYRPLDPSKRYPLIDFHITEKQALKMCIDEGFDFGGLYNYFDRVSCWCCPLGGIKRARMLYNKFPELWDKLKMMENLLGVYDFYTDHKEGFLENENCSELEQRFIAENKQMELF